MGIRWGTKSCGGLEATFIGDCPPEVVPCGLRDMAGGIPWGFTTDGVVGPGEFSVEGREFRIPFGGTACSSCKLDTPR
eukprot:1442168-Heterocapsa_arctica.AAC.1